MATKVIVVESERGWGQRVDEVKTFATRTEAEEFVRGFNSENVEDSAPDWYMHAYIAEGLSS